MRRLALLPGVLLTLLLAACSAPGGLNDEIEGPVVITGLSPWVALPGEALIISGSGFGTGGSVEIGGVEASIVHWEDTAIEAVVAEGTPAGPREVAVVTGYGEDRFSELFIGTEYEGEGNQLQAFLSGLERGTAVLLQEGEYDLTGLEDPFVVMDLGLYGRGQAATTLLSPSGLMIVAESFEAILARMTVHTPDLEVSGDESSTDFGEVSSLSPNTQQDALSVVLRELSVIQSAGSLGSYYLEPSEVVLDGFAYSGPDSEFNLRASGEVSVSDSQILANLLHLSSGGLVTVVESELEAPALTVAASAGVDVRGSNLTASAGNLIIAGGPPKPGLTELEEGSAGPIAISGSTLDAADGDLADGVEAGKIAILTQFAPIDLTQNVRVSAQGELSIVHLAGAGAKAVSLTGNQDVSAGGSLTVSVLGPGTLTLAGNNVTAQQDIWISAEALAGGSAEVTDNSISVRGEGERLAIELLAGSCAIERNLLEVDNPTGESNQLLLRCLGEEEAEGNFTVLDNELGASGDGPALDGEFEFGDVDLSRNLVSSEGGFDLYGAELTGSLSDNVFTLRERGVKLIGVGPTTLEFNGNSVTVDVAEDYGLSLLDLAAISVSDNEITTAGTTAGASVALSVEVLLRSTSVDAHGNTFRDFDRALYFEDRASTARGIAAEINHNRFDLVFDAAPQVAELRNVKDEIDARFNRWQGVGDAAVLMGYVTSSGDTTTQGGSIVLDPVADQ